MQRRPPLLMILLLLVAGAIVNVAVAQAPELLDDGERLMAFVEQPWPGRADHVSAWVLEFRDWGVQVRQARMIDPTLQPLGSRFQASFVLMTEFSAGWPFHAMRGWSLPGGARAPAVRSARVILMGRSQKFVPPVLPLRSIWPGFAINTLFYAGVLWLLFAAPFALRRRRRIKRGLCPKCAYPVGTNERCTECGATHEVKP